MMLKGNKNFKDRTGNSSHNFANRLWCASAHREQASADTMRVGAKSLRWSSLRASAQKNSSERGFSLVSYAVRTRRSLEKSSYSKIAGWSLVALAVFGTFGYLTFIPEQAFAAYDWEQRTLSDINTMQEMNAKICENSEIGESKQLEDARDRVNGQAGTGKKYWVTKLADNNCWMTQNLAYDGGGIVTPFSDWPSSNNGTPRYVKGAHTEAHESQGNFYSWEAAMNGDISASEPVQGICPDKWQLPVNGGGTGNKTFASLLTEYGVQSNPSGTGKDGKNYTINGAPLYFQYSGVVDRGSLSNESFGYYWSSTLHDTNMDAYFLYLTGSYVGPSSNNLLYLGMSVRCVAADVYPELNNSSEANVAITVSPVISIDVTKHANDMTVDFTKVAISTIVARVGSNQPYKVMLSTDKSNLTNPKTNQTIPMIPSDQIIVKGTNSWGIKKLSSPTDTTVNENTTYSPVGINGSKELFYTSTSAASEDLTFPVAIAVDSGLLSGQYSTQVTLTAVAM